MKVSIQVRTPKDSATAASVDAIGSSIRSEIDAFSEAYPDVQMAEQTKKPQDGAMGGPELLEFLLEMAKDPTTWNAAITLLLHQLNSIAKGQTKAKESDTEEKKQVQVSLGGRSIMLPVGAAAISKFIQIVTSEDAE